MAGVICLTQLTTVLESTAKLTTLILVLAALSGAYLGRKRVVNDYRNPDWYAVLLGLAVFAVFGAPIFLSGSASIGAYGVDSAAAVHLIGADSLLEIGRSNPGPPKSSYSLVLTDYFFGTGYPSGTHTAFGALSKVSGASLVWSFNSFIAFMCSGIALALYQVSNRVFSSRAVRAGSVFIATQATLFYRYALNGSIKEVGVLLAVTLVAALALSSYKEITKSLKVTVPIAVAVAAVVGAIGPTAIIWVGPMLFGILIWFIVANRGTGLKTVLFSVGALGLLVALLSLPTLLELKSMVSSASGVGSASNSDIGYLYGELTKMLVFGSWFTGDFRDQTSYRLLVVALSGLVALLVIFYGLVRPIFKRPEMLVLASGTVIGWLYVLKVGSFWGQGKAMAIASPVVVLWAMAGAKVLSLKVSRVVAVVCMSVLSVAILWSNVLAYRGVSLAPHDRFEELASLNSRLPKSGLTLSPDFEEYVKYFLRNGNPESITESLKANFKPDNYRKGLPPSGGYGVDLDLLSPEYIQIHDRILLRRSPVGSRPPYNYKQTYSGKNYELWTKNSAVKVLDRVPLGPTESSESSQAVPGCPLLKETLKRAKDANAMVVYSFRPAVSTFVTADHKLPPSWFSYETQEFVVHTFGAGSTIGSVNAEVSGPYTLWAQGAFTRKTTFSMDGSLVGSLKNSLNPRDQYEEIGELDLTKGSHKVEIKRQGTTLEPGNGSSAGTLGPVLIVSKDQQPYKIDTVTEDNYRDLCSKRMDWLEIVSSQ